MENKKNVFSGIIIPTIILTLIIIITATLYYYDNKYEKDNLVLSENIKKTEQKIKEIKANKNLQIYDILTKNKKIIDKLNNYSKIPRFIKGIEYIENKYKLSIEGFNYSQGIITSNVTADFTKSSNTYLTTAEFIKNYRNDEKVDFELPFISSFKSNGIPGKRNMKFNLKLKVKDKLFEANEEEKK